MVISFVVVGNRCLRASRDFLRVSLHRAQTADPRRPVLFLRSFRDDSVVLPPPTSGFAYKLFNHSERNKSLDELLLEEGTALGPVVALGNPTDTVPPYGAARGYVQHGNWRTMVADLMESATVIVICVDNTESLWWEIEYVREHEYLGKTLLLLHPKYDPKNQAPDITERVLQVLGCAMVNGMGAPERGKLMGLWLDGESQLRIGSASHFSRAHYLLMLRWFLRSKMEDEQLRTMASRKLQHALGSQLRSGQQGPRLWAADQDTDALTCDRMALS